METRHESIFIIDPKNYRRDCSNSCLLFMYCHCRCRSIYLPGISEYRYPFESYSLFPAG